MVCYNGITVVPVYASECLCFSFMLSLISSAWFYHQLVVYFTTFCKVFQSKIHEWHMNEVVKFFSWFPQIPQLRICADTEHQLDTSVLFFPDLTSVYFTVSNMSCTVTVADVTEFVQWHYQRNYIWRELVTSLPMPNLLNKANILALIYSIYWCIGILGRRM